MTFVEDDGGRAEAGFRGETVSKEELVDAAVEVVKRAADRAIADAAESEDRGGFRERGYVEAYQVANSLRERGLLDHDGFGSGSYSQAEAARRSVDGKAKRLLEQAVSDGRLVRWSTRSDGPAPQLDGFGRAYGNALYFATPELLRRGKEAVAARIECERREDEEMRDLLQRARLAGLPEPINSGRGFVQFDRDGLAELVRLVEEVAS